jgi:hypothetical protein
MPFERIRQGPQGAAARRSGRNAAPLAALPRSEILVGALRAMIAFRARP